MLEAVDYSAARFWFDITQTVFVVGVAVYAWLSNRHRATNDAIDRVEEQARKDTEAVEARVDEHRDRIILVEEMLRHLPSSKDIGEVHYRVDQIGQGVTGLEGQMSQMNNTLHLIQQYLLEREK